MMVMVQSVVTCNDGYRGGCMKGPTQPMMAIVASKLDLREDDEATQGARANATNKRERGITLRGQRRDANTEAKNTIGAATTVQLTIHGSRRRPEAVRAAVPKERGRARSSTSREGLDDRARLLHRVAQARIVQCEST